MWRNLLLRCIYSGIFLQEKLRYILALLLYPLYKGLVIEVGRRLYGFEFVRGHAKKWNELGILRNEKQVFLRFAPNFGYGFAQNLCSGDLSVYNLPELMKGTRDRNQNLWKDPFHVLSQMVNLQKGNLAWNVASHYNTGTTLIFSSLGEY